MLLRVRYAAGGARGAIARPDPWLLPLLCFLRKCRGDGRVPPAWEFRILADTPDRFRFEITRCYFLDTLTALGVPELTAGYCHNDDVMWGGLRHLELRREDPWHWEPSVVISASSGATQVMRQRLAD